MYIFLSFTLKKIFGKKNLWGAIKNHLKNKSRGVTFGIKIKPTSQAFLVGVATAVS